MGVTLDTLSIVAAPSLNNAVFAKGGTSQNHAHSFGRDQLAPMLDEALAALPESLSAPSDLQE